MIQRQAAASVTDPLLCDSLVKKKRQTERKRNTECKLLEVIKGGIVFENCACERCATNRLTDSSQFSLVSDARHWHCSVSLPALLK